MQRKPPNETSTLVAILVARRGKSFPIAPPNMENNVTHLDQIARSIEELHCQIRLRSALETARQLGELLLEAKALVLHGEWLGWLRSHCPNVSTRTCQLYMQVAATEIQPIGEMGFVEFVAHLKRGRREERRAELEQFRDEMAAQGRMAETPDRVQLVHANCRKYEWPEQIDVVATDPAWADMEAYRWLGTFCSTRLREGGLLLVQCGVGRLHDVINILLESGLHYVHCMAIAYEQMRSAPKPLYFFAGTWRPVLVFSRGKPDRRGLSRRSDTEIVRTHRQDHHDWEQPLRPWSYWLSGLASPGALVADPFAGSATTGVAVLEVGDGRTWLGTEIDERRYLVAKARLSESIPAAESASRRHQKETA